METTITRMLRSLTFFWKGTELKFDDFTISVPEEDAIGKIYDKNKSHMYEILFTLTSENVGKNTVIITNIKHIIEESYHKWMVNDIDKLSTSESYLYNFTSYFPVGTLDMVPSINASGYIESKKQKLDLEVGKHYQITLKQKEKEKDDIRI
jgi:hypothetical protein